MMLVVRRFLRVMSRRIGKVEVGDLEDVLLACEWCLCGTSWQSDLEWEVIDQAQALGKHVVVFLDHWGNYQERFVRNGIKHLPNELWTGDSIAFDIATLEFPHLPIKLIENPYFEDVRYDLLQLPQRNEDSSEKGLTILYACEPIGEHALQKYGDDRYWGYNEYDALNYFLEHLYVLEEPIRKLIVRPHPSEPLNKYEWVGEQFGDFVVQGGVATLLEEINQSDIVVGCETMALVVAFVAGRRAISCIPYGTKTCPLPQEEIEHWSEIIERYLSRE
jgi:hypothetical protein